jgi:ATP-dependent protease HslVU (ClpYQ) peptidase subunit
MTTIAGLQKYIGWEMAADGQTTSADRPFESMLQPKIVMRADYTFACAGKGYACDVAAFHWSPPESTADVTHGGMYAHLVKNVVPSLRREFDRAGVTFEADEAFQMLIAHRELIAQIESDFTVLLADNGLYAIGSGAAYALGAMEAGADVDEAVRIASRFDIWTGSQVEHMTGG